MSELHSWLSSQHHGLRTYKSLKQKLLRLADSDPAHVALYRLLASMIDPYIDAFDEQPLPVDVADKTFDACLTLCVTLKRRFLWSRLIRSKCSIGSRQSN
jgi:hypothetical protein